MKAHTALSDKYPDQQHPHSEAECEKLHGHQDARGLMQADVSAGNLKHFWMIMSPGRNTGSSLRKRMLYNRTNRTKRDTDIQVAYLIDNMCFLSGHF